MSNSGAAVEESDRNSVKSPRGRIMVVVPALNEGGTELHIASIMPLLAERGFDVTVAAVAARGPVENKLRSSNIRVIEPPGSDIDDGVTRSVRGRPIAGTYALIRDLKRRPVDIIHGFLPLGYLAGRFAARVTKTPIMIMSRRNLDHYQKRYPGLARLESYLHKQTSFILANSKAIADELLNEGAPPERVGIIYNGVELPPSNIDFDRDRTRAVLGIGPEALVLTIVANLIPYKGHYDLLSALAGISDQLPSGWILQIVGRDDGLGGELQAYSHSLGLEKNIRFLGQRQDVSELLKISDIGLLVSHEEGFSNAVLESMAASLPMIVTDVGGNPEAVINGKHGFVVPACDPGQLGRAILNLATDTELQHRFGQAGFKRVQDVFSQAACVANYCDLYDALLEGRVPEISMARAF